LWEKGKLMHILQKPKTSTQEIRQQVTKYCCWEIMIIVRIVYASSSAAPPTPLITLPFTTNGLHTQRFAPNTVTGKILLTERVL
jgi:hypothetical protein